MVERVGQLMAAKSGFRIAKCKCYDGFNMQYFWGVFKPNGEYYISGDSFEKAYELANSLAEVADVRN